MVSLAWIFLLLSPVVLAQQAKKPFCDCGTDYEPVCAMDDQTYGNACVAACFNQAIRHTGKCKKCPVRFGVCNCNGKPYAPVCATGLTWRNRCDAECGGRVCGRSTICENSKGDSYAPTVGGDSATVRQAAETITFPPKASPRHRYDTALHMSLMFYESQRSGILPRHRFAWRGDSCTTCVGPEGEDISGGYLEAGGSYLKMSMPSAFTVTQLAWTVITFAKGYQKSGELEDALDAVKWGADFLINSHSGPEKMVAMTGISNDDFNYYGPPEEKELWVENGWGRSCYATPEEPATEAIAESAAALAATALLFKKRDPDYSALALTHATQLYDMAMKYQGSYSDSVNPCMKIMAALYQSTGFKDELAWAAGWMYAATKENQYLQDARRLYNAWDDAEGPGYTLNTNDKGPALHVLMYWQDVKKSEKYLQANRAFFYQYLTQTIPHTPKGLAYAFHWGALRGATNIAFLAFAQSKYILERGKIQKNVDYHLAAKLFNYGKHQVDYVLGSSGRSWMVGYGRDYPTHIWHKPSLNSYIDWELRGQYMWMGQDRGPWTIGVDYNATHPAVIESSKAEMEGNYRPNTFIVYGALFGAPLADDGLVTTRRDYTYSEPTTEGQGGITGALAALAEYFDGMTPQDDCQLDLGFSHPNATRTAKTVVLC